MTVKGVGLPGGQADRRSVLRWLTGACVAATCAPVIIDSKPALAAIGGSERRISLINNNNGETFDGVYWRDGRFLPDQLQRLAVLLRDHRTGQVAHMDPKLYDIMWQVSRAVDGSDPFRVICGYRCPKTNAINRRQHRGVARDSLHIHGMAVDVRMEGRSVAALAHAARDLQTGGVGYYPRSGFVHLDAGAVRHW